MPLRLILFGRQGAGKGTQCDALVARYGAVHISTGDILREAAIDGTELGRRAQALMEAGELVPDDLIVDIVGERLAKADVRQHGFILDGFPRTLPQAESLWEACGPEGIDLAVDLDVPLEVVKDRMLGRGREDDNEEAIARRLELYESQTVPAILFFASRDKLISVDGVGTPEEVSERLLAAIDEATRS